MTDRELLQQALDALENLQGLCSEESGFVEQVTIWTPEIIAALRQRLAQPEPEGWKWVPVEPTPEMWKAVNKLDDEMAAGSYDGRGCTIEQAWHCLLAAAPQKGTL